MSLRKQVPPNGLAWTDAQGRPTDTFFDYIKNLESRSLAQTVEMPTVSLTFDYYKEGGDDGYWNHLTSRSLVGTYYVTPATIGTAGFSTADELLLLIQGGMEIGWYTNINMVTDQTSNRTICFARFPQAIADMQALGITPKTLAPNQRAWNTALAGHAYMTGWTGVRNAGTFTDQTWPVSNPWWVENGGTSSFSSSDTLQALKNKLDATIAAKSWWIPVIHKIGTVPDSLTILDTIFDDFMTYLAAKRDAGLVRVCTFERALKHAAYQ